MLSSATVLAGPVAVIVGRSVMPRTEELSEPPVLHPGWTTESSLTGTVTAIG